MVPPRSARIEPAVRVSGRIRVPGDKSISHRYAVLASLAVGRSVVRGFAPGGDCRSTLACLEALGVDVSRAGGSITLVGRGPAGLRSPREPLDAGNSGTTARLLAGVLAGLPFEATLVGDESLSRRPMRRVIDPLTRMGARFESSGGTLPIRVAGGPLRAIDHETDAPSAQVKSAILLAALQASGTTRVTERHQTRNHSELALRRFGADVGVEGLTVSVAGGGTLRGVQLEVPGDFSSAAFWCAAAAALPGSAVEIEGVGLNPTRTRLLEVLERAGASVTVSIESEGEGEPSGRLRVVHREVGPVVVAPDEVPGLIDELPALAAMATHGGGITVTGASELRTKESDRISALVTGLQALGAEAEELADGFCVRGGRRLTGGVCDSAGDHRLAMAFAVAALGASGPSTILGAGAVDISYPGFFDHLGSLAA